MSGSHTLAHAITGEHSRFRRWTLYILARFIEMPLLYLGYHLLRGRFQWLGRNRLVRALLGWGVAVPFGYLGDTARPIPYPQILDVIDALDGPIGVGPCRCRTAHHGCRHSPETEPGLDTDIVIRTGVDAWTRAFPHDYRLIDKTQVKHIIAECHRQGMWHMVFIHCPVTDKNKQENEYVICNCCTCGCLPYILNRELGQRMYPLLRGEYIARTDPRRCTGHGTCVTACPFDARTLADGKVTMTGTCLGCGMCAAACPERAIEIVLRET